MKRITEGHGKYLLMLDMEGNINPKATQCKLKKLILYTSNRFDYDIFDKLEYYSLLTLLSKQKTTKIVWVENNPFEQYYTNKKMGYNAPKVLHFNLVYTYSSIWPNKIFNF